MRKWFVYLLVSCNRRRTYIGMTCDLKRRLRQHNGELKGGACWTRTGRPWRIARIIGTYTNRRDALRVEWRAKRFRGRERFKHRDWVSKLDDDAADKDKHLHHYKRRRRRRRR